MEGYEVIKEIGKGSFGVVHQARRLEDGVLVAIKKMLKFRRNEMELKNLREEWNIQRRLNHPNIVRVFDSFETLDCMVIVMEYAEEGELAKLITSMHGRGLSMERVRRITGDLVSALSYLFNERILHRDLKPQNVLIGSDGLCKLCDFGFAKTLDVNNFLLTSIKGTPLYMAPEMFLQGIYNETAELWSLGCIVYEMVVGRPPFSTASLFALIHMIRSTDIKFDENLFTGHCRSFVKGLLQKNPDHRMNLKKVLDHPFVRDLLNTDIVEGENSLTKALTPSQEMEKEKQRMQLQRKVHDLNRLVYKTQRKIHKAQKELDKCAANTPRHVKTPAHSPGLAMNHAQTESGINRHDSGGMAEVTHMVNKLNVTKPADDSDSSCETLTSSSDDDIDSDEDVRTIVNGSGNDPGVMKSSGDGHHSQAQIGDGRGADMFWKSESLFGLHSLGTDDKPIQSEEWVHFLITTMKEVAENPQCLCEKHFLTVLVAPLRNHLTTPVVAEKVADVLTLPFTLEDMPSELVIMLRSMYTDSKVLPNLLYSCKVTVQRRVSESICKDLDKIISALMVEDLTALSKCLSLVSFLVFMDESFVIQFCDSLCVLQLFPILLLFIKLDFHNVTFANDTLAMLCHLIRVVPDNYCIVEELFFGNCPIGNNVDELWRLLRHKNPSIQSKALRLLTYLGINSCKTRETFIRTNTLELWKLVKLARDSSSLALKKAGYFASSNLKELSVEELPALQLAQQRLEVPDDFHHVPSSITSSHHTLELPIPVLTASDQSR